MGTGSHRPQWEAAKGRPDVYTGIRHSRALKSHSRLKYRDRTSKPTLQQKDPSKMISSHEAGDRPESLSEELSQSELPASDGESPVVHATPEDDNSDSSSEDDDDEDLRKELEILKNRSKLRSQLEASDDSPKSTWRSEVSFRQRPIQKKRQKQNKLLNEIIK